MHQHLFNHGKPWRGWASIHGLAWMSNHSVPGHRSTASLSWPRVRGFDRSPNLTVSSTGSASVRECMCMTGGGGAGAGAAVPQGRAKKALPGGGQGQGPRRRQAPPHRRLGHAATLVGPAARRPGDCGAALVRARRAAEAVRRESSHV